MVGGCHPEIFMLEDNVLLAMVGMPSAIGGQTRTYIWVYWPRYRAKAGPTWASPSAARPELGSDE